MRQTHGFLLMPALLMTIIGCGVDEKPAAAGASQSGVRGATPPAKRAPARPEALVKTLYEQHGLKQSPFFQTTNRELVDRYFEKTLADLIWNDAVASKGEVGALDSDPLYAAQDTDIKNLVVRSAVVDGGNARVAVTFDNFGAQEEIIYSLAAAGESWMITDITYGDGRTLRSILRSGLPQPENSIPPKLR